MPVVLLLLFQVVAGIALFIFLLHYLSYIFNAIIRDFCETLLTTKEFLQQLQETCGGASSATNHYTPNNPSLQLLNNSDNNNTYPRVFYDNSNCISSSSSSSSNSGGDKRSFSKIPIKVQKMQPSTDDAKFIKNP